MRPSSAVYLETMRLVAGGTLAIGRYGKLNLIDPAVHDVGDRGGCHPRCGVCSVQLVLLRHVGIRSVLDTQTSRTGRLLDALTD